MSGPAETDTRSIASRRITLVLGPRPGRKSLPTLATRGLTHVCTLLSEREGASTIESLAQKIGCTWIWLPIEGGSLDHLRHTHLEHHVTTLLGALRNEPQPNVYLHCSAGIHRTGFFAYTLLRLSGLDSDAARRELARLRPVTADQVGADRLALAEEMIAAFGPQ
jgi:protein-tyrosine phosphatase